MVALERELRSPEKPIKSIKLGPVLFVLGILMLGLVYVVVSVVYEGEETKKTFEQKQDVVPATEKLQAIEDMPSSYDNAEMWRAREAQASAHEGQDQQPTMQPQYDASAVQQGSAPSQDFSPPDSGDESAEAKKSSIMFGSIRNAPSSPEPSQQMEARGGEMLEGKPHGSRIPTEKEQFLDSGNSGPKRLERMRSKFIVAQGSVLPATLLTAINSDLPGPIVAQLRTNIFDSRSGKYLLIPQGTKIVGEYNSKITPGQNRAQVVWTRLLLPNGDSLELGRMPGVDGEGSSGISGKVDSHVDQLLIGVLVSSLVSAGAAISQGPVNSMGVTPQQALGQSVAQEASRMGSKVADRALDIQPTVRVPAGATLNVFATSDLFLQPYRY